MWARLRRSAVAAYVLAGIISWPVVTAVIYWADRLTAGEPGSGQAGAGIGLWPACGCALVVSALIVIAGWLQSSHPS
jgi:hypothetical protein